MHNHQPVSQQQLAREKALYLYLSAFEQGDFDTMDTVLQEAMRDPVLEEMILEAHEYYLAEEKMALQEEEREKVLNLVLQHLPSGIWDEDAEIAIPPLTVGDVFARLQEDTTIRGAVKQEVQDIRQRLPEAAQPLPDNLTVRSVYQLFERFGLSVSAALKKLFREKAILLSMTREQGIAQLAATRRQKSKRQQRLEEESHRDQ